MLISYLFNEIKIYFPDAVSNYPSYAATNLRLFLLFLKTQNFVRYLSFKLLKCLSLKKTFLARVILSFTAVYYLMFTFYVG